MAAVHARVSVVISALVNEGLAKTSCQCCRVQTCGMLKNPTRVMKLPTVRVIAGKPASANRTAITPPRNQKAPSAGVKCVRA